jgi:hypothetical protein
MKARLVGELATPNQHPVWEAMAIRKLAGTVDHKTAWGLMSCIELSRLAADPGVHCPV